MGREAQNPGVDGAIARTTYLEPDARMGDSDAAGAVLLKKQADLEAQVEVLKGRKPSMSPGAYYAELERLLTELARVSQQIRAKS